MLQCFIPMADVVCQDTLGLVLHQFNWPNLGQSSRFYTQEKKKDRMNYYLSADLFKTVTESLAEKAEFNLRSRSTLLFMITVIKLPGLKTAIALRQPHSLPSGESCLYLLINSCTTQNQPQHGKIK